jgi:hypothetical protein
MPWLKAVANARNSETSARKLNGGPYDGKQKVQGFIPTTAMRRPVAAPSLR